jgi:hypothetical protein
MRNRKHFDRKKKNKGKICKENEADKGITLSIFNNVVGYWRC